MANLTQQSFANSATSYFLKTEDASNLGSNWASFPALQDVNLSSHNLSNVSQGTANTWSAHQFLISGQTLTANPSFLFFNGIALVNVSDIQDIADWALYPAVTSIDVNNHSINNISQLTLDTQTITSTPTSVLVNNQDQTRNWAYFTALHDVNLSSHNITNVNQLQLTGHIITSTPSALLVDNQNPVQNWSSFPATNVSLTTINGQTQFGANQWSSFPATQDVNLSGHNISNVEYIVGYTGNPLHNGLEIDEVYTIQGRTTGGMIIGNSTQDLYASKVATQTVQAGDSNTNNGAMVAYGQLLAYGTTGGHTLATLPVAGVYTNRLDIFPAGGIDMFSPSFITLNGGVLNITGAGACAIAGSVITMDHDPTTYVRIKGTGSAGGKLYFPNGGDVSNVNNYDGFSATLNQLNTRGTSTTIGFTANVLDIHGLQIPFSFLYSNTNISLQGSIVATQEITVSGVPVAQTIKNTTSNVLYVAKNGNDSNPGSILLPKLTIQNAITTAESLGLTSQTQVQIFIAPGHYTENITFTTGYVSLIAQPVFSNQNELTEITGNISVAIVSGIDDLYNRQVLIQGISVTGNIADTSSVKHTLALVSTRFYGTSRVIYQNSSVDNRTYLEDLTVTQSAPSGLTNPMIHINSGTCSFERVDQDCLDNCNLVLISGTATLARCLLSQFISNTESATAPAILEITSTSTTFHQFNNCKFAYTSPTNKTANSASSGIRLNTTANAYINVQYSQFNLYGTSDPENHAIEKTNTGVPTIGYFQNACNLGATKIQSTGTVRVPATAMS